LNLCLQTENEVMDRLRSIIAEHYDVDESTVRKLRSLKRTFECDNGIGRVREFNGFDHIDMNIISE
jgi:hypothetical protein